MLSKCNLSDLIVFTIILFVSTNLLVACSTPEEAQFPLSPEIPSKASETDIPASPSVEETGPVTISYAYDEVGRLVGAEYNDGTSISYEYDSNGNMLSRKVQTEGAAINNGGKLFAAAFLLVALTLYLPTPKFSRRVAQSTLHVLLIFAIILGFVVPVSVQAGNKIPPGEDNPPVTNGDDTGNTSATIEDPISAATGEYYFRENLFDLGGILPVEFNLFYGTQMEFKPMGDGFPYSRALAGFRGSHRIYLRESDVHGTPIIIAEMGLGQEIGFKYGDNGWEVFGREPIKYQLIQTERSFYLLDPIKEWVYIFMRDAGRSVNSGYLEYIVDRNGNMLIYDNPTDNQTLEAQGPNGISDGLGRELRFSYKNIRPSGYPSYVMTKIEDRNGRAVVFNYEDAAADNSDLYTLRSITDPMGNVTTFHYAGDYLIETIERPNGNSPYLQTYSAYEEFEPALVTSQTDAYGNTTQIDVDMYESQLVREDSSIGFLFLRQTEEDSQVTVTYPDDTQRVFEHTNQAKVLSSIYDLQGNTTYFENDGIHDRITGVEDRMGDVTRVEYHQETGKLLSITNAHNDSISFDYDAQEQVITHPASGEQVTFNFYNMAQIVYPDGSIQTFTYDNWGNMISRTDQSGAIWEYRYSERGQILTETNPSGGATSYTYHDDGTLASSGDSDTEETSFYYDEYKRLIEIVYPDGTNTQVTYNLNDQITTYVNENGHTYTYSYDANGNLVEIIDPMGEVFAYEHDLLDRLSNLTERTGDQTAITYDNMGRIVSHSDSAGVTMNYGYDSRGWLNQLSIGESTWETVLDSEGIPMSVISPLGNQTDYESDKLGYLVAWADALGNKSIMDRDANSRVTGVTNALGYSTAYTYDDRGLLSGIQLPNHSSVAFRWNALGLLENVNDLNESQWNFAYTPMGRIKELSDPISNVWAYTYDESGMLSTIVYPDGGSQTKVYDAVGNAIQTIYDDLTLNFTYDSLNRLTETNGLSLEYDAEGRVIETINDDFTSSATYGPAGRLESIAYGNEMTVSYIYDPITGLLTGIEDDLTGAKLTFVYDADFNLTSIERSNGVTASFTWDAAGRLTHIQDGEILDLLYSLDATGQVIEATMVTPLNGSKAGLLDNRSYEYDAASQISSSGYEYDAQGRLTSDPDHTYTWDDASRLTAIDDVSLTYNGLGELESRTQNGNTTRYAYNYALEFAPTIAELDDSTGDDLRYYVWTPDGQLLYMVDTSAGEPYFYHYDRIGSTLALTNGNGNVSVAYEYAPYGEILSQQGDNTQSFTFVGEWGVRKESADLYHMRARYYKPSSACFTSREPLWPDIAEPRNLNPYQYAINNPLRNIDHTGKSLIENIVSAGGDLTELLPGVDIINQWLFDPEKIENEGMPMGDWTDYLFNLSDSRQLYDFSRSLAERMTTLEHEEFLKQREAELQKMAEEEAKRQAEMDEWGEKLSPGFSDMMQRMNEFYEWKKIAEAEYRASQSDIIIGEIVIGDRDSAPKIIWHVIKATGQ